MQFGWQDLLHRWNLDLLSCPRVVEQLSTVVVTAQWLGQPPATREQIEQAEARLRVSLPPSYRQFLAITNGWLDLGRWVGPLVPAQDVEWFRLRHQDYIDEWFVGENYAGHPPAIPDSDYFSYGEAQLPESLRSEYLTTALQISELGRTGSEVYLLNPRITNPEGEWEAWFLAPWLPGAHRYRSFWDLMNAEYSAYKC